MAHLRASGVVWLVALGALLAAAEPAAATFRGRDGLIAFVRVNDAERKQSLWVVQPDGRRARPIPWGRPHRERDWHQNWDYREPQWSPDGRSLAVVRSGEWGPSRVMIARPWNTKPRFFAYGSEPAWSPDGRTIAFTQIHEDDPYAHYETTYMYAKRTTGGRKRVLTKWSEARLFNLSWSPDGTRIAFDEDGDGLGTENDIYALAVADGADEPMVATGDHEANPDWNPRGFPMVLECIWDRSWFELCLYDPNQQGEYGNGVTYLWHERPLESDRWDFDPVWSPSGRRIVWSRTHPKSVYDLFIVRPDGTHRRRITHGPAWDVDPSWQPRPRR